VNESIESIVNKDVTGEVSVSIETHFPTDDFVQDPFKTTSGTNLAELTL
jgi:hypothetical protein